VKVSWDELLWKLSNGLAHELPVIAQVADDRMLLDELEALLRWCRVLMIDELPQAAEVIRPMSLGDLAGVFHNLA
jgi:hypothetical protein